MINKKINKLNLILATSTAFNLINLNQMTFALPTSECCLGQSNSEKEKNTLAIVADDITVDNIIDRLHIGNKEKLERLEKDLIKVRDDDYESLDNIARKYFNNEDIELPKNPKIAKIWIINWFKVSQVFPCLIGNVRLVSSKDKLDCEYSVAFSYMFDGEHFIYHFRDIDESIKPKTQQVKNYDRRYTIVHEFGHVIDRSIRVKKPKTDSKDGYDIEFISREIIEKVCEKIGIDKEKIKDKIMLVSEYAGSQEKEWQMFTEGFAEIITDVVINGEEASELSKEVVKYLVNIR